MLRSFWRRLSAIVFVFTVVACSGGGCTSGCAGCGVTPLPGGFPKASTVENAAAARVTRHGLDFLGDNLGTVAGAAMGQGGTLSFDIPHSTTKITFINIEICKNPNSTQCKALIDLPNAKLHLDAAEYTSVNGEPAIRVSGTVPVKVDDIPVNTSLGNMEIGIGNGGCSNGKPNVTYADFPVEAILPLVAETIAPRDGYTKIDTANMVVSATIDSGHVQLCGGFLSTIVNLFKSYVVGQIVGPLQNTLKSTLQSQLCTKPTANVNPPCPTGSQPSNDNSKCVYKSDPNTCVPMLLGMDGHMDLSGALASLSPGTAGGLDFVLAAGGNMIPTTDPGVTAPPDGNKNAPNGMTLGFLGGTLPQPQSGCVPAFDNQIPTGIPIPDEMESNAVSPWPQGDKGPDLGIALAGRFLNYAFGSVYNSGLLCLGVSTEQVSQLQSGLLSVLIPSIKKLTFEQKGAPVAITTRPQKPPVVSIGGGTDLKTDPLLNISLQAFSIDFYVWSMDRYVRAFTFTGDLTIPVNLSTAVDPNTNPNGALLPIIGDIGVANAKVTNAGLLTDDPATVATSLSSLLGGIAGQFLGSIKPIDLSSSLASFGLGMTIPDGGIRKLTKDSDDFVGIFADLSLAKGNAVQQADVQARVLDKKVWPEAMGLATADRAKLPELHMQFGSSLDNGAHVVEYSYAVDEGTHSEWKVGRDVTIKNDALFLQGKHVLKVWARVKGEEMSQSAEPALVPFTIDTLPPFVTLDHSGADLHVSAWDIVSDTSALQQRYRVTDAIGKKGEWTPWGAVADIPSAVVDGAQSVTVEVKDEDGNVQSQEEGLIRGRNDPTLGAAGGCGCSAPGSTPQNAWLWSIPALLGLAALGWRRRRAHGGSPRGERRGTGAAPLPFFAEARKIGSARAATVTFGTIALVAAFNPGCNCGGNDGSGANGCGSDCKQTCDSALPMGLIGAYTSVAAAKDGTIWVAGYNDSVLSETLGFNFLYGDLVVGKWDSGKQAVQWQSVDGLPPAPTDGSCPDNDPTGWRGGLVDPGDDVGLWTSMQLDDQGNPMVAYYDATNMQLKFAAFDGSKWNIHVVQQKAGADIGRYVKMIMVNGKPVIAFLAMEKGTGGATKARVVVGRASTAVPQSSTDWAFEDAAVDDAGPCEPQFCGSNEACLATTFTCTPTVGGCQPACASGNACVTDNGNATCVAIVDPNIPTSYPNAYGDYISLAASPSGTLGVVIYDRVHGNLVGVSNAGGKWTATILDGETGTRPNATDTGDDGIAATLFIAPNGDWHVAYINGIQEHLQYLLWPGGAGQPLAPEVVDDGFDSGKPYPDGQHIVGDDATMQVDASGNVKIAYQDSTAGVLRVATGAPGQSGTHTWTAKTIAQTGKFAGFFPKFVPGTSQIANWYRQTDQATKDTIGDVALVNP